MFGAHQRRWWNLAGFGACVGLMAYALYAEHALGLEPCPLCVFQRIAVIVLGVVFLVAALHDPGRIGARVYGGLQGVAALAGAGVAVQHLRVQATAGEQVAACGPDLGTTMTAFPLHEALGMVFSGSGDCAEIDWSFLGLSMPGWVLVSALALGALGVAANWLRS